MTSECLGALFMTTRCGDPLQNDISLAQGWANQRASFSISSGVVNGIVIHIDGGCKLVKILPICNVCHVRIILLRYG